MYSSQWGQGRHKDGGFEDGVFRLLDQLRTLCVESGCTMTELGYIGDERKDYIDAFAQQYGVNEAIVLVSDFETGPSGGGGSLNPNDTYRNYKWILLRDTDGSWSHADHGYG